MVDYFICPICFADATSHRTITKNGHYRWWTWLLAAFLQHVGEVLATIATTCQILSGREWDHMPLLGTLLCSRASFGTSRCRTRVDYIHSANVLSDDLSNCAQKGITVFVGTVRTIYIYIYYNSLSLHITISYIPIAKSKYFLRSFALCISLELDQFPFEIKLVFRLSACSDLHFGDRNEHLVSNDLHTSCGWLFFWFAMLNCFLAEKHHTLFEHETHGV